jgi:hypothetical protein
MLLILYLICAPLQFVTTNYPEESFTSTFKAQARDRFPQAAVYAPLSTVDDIRTAAALAATSLNASQDNHGEASTAPAADGQATSAPSSA